MAFAHIEELSIAHVDLTKPSQLLGNPWGDWAWRKGHRSSQVLIKCDLLGPDWFYAIQLFRWRHDCREAGEHYLADWATHVLRVCGLEKAKTRRGTRGKGRKS